MSEHSTRLNYGHPIPGTPSRRGWRLLGVLAVSTLSTLAACSSAGDSADKVASVGSAENGDTAGDTGDVNADDVLAQYRECMAAEGIDIPAPPVEGGNAVGSTTEPPPLDADPDDIAAADAKCSEQLPDAPNPLEGLTPDQLAAFEDYQLEVQRCVDDKGYEGMPIMGDDTPGATEPPDFDWDAFDQAVSDCYDSIPLPEELAGIEPEG